MTGSPPRRWSRERILRELVRRCGLPVGGQLRRDQGALLLEYRDSGLRRRLSVYPSAPGRLQWVVDVGDAELEVPGMRAFWTRYWVRSDLLGGADGVPGRDFTGYPWPVAGGQLDDDLVADVRRFAPGMLWFLGDRADLGRMLLDGRAERDGVFGDRYAGPEAGLVQAVLLARAVPLPELAARAMETLDRRRDERPDGPDGRTVAQLVSDWAGRHPVEVPGGIEDLRALARS